jgi:predicted dehydrogenase
VKTDRTTQKTYRVGIIGCGGMARAHANAYQELPETEIVAGADISADALQKFGETYNVTALYTDYHEMLANESLDIVDVCTWPRLHPDPTIAAAEAGVKGVICEKPMALSLAEADAMIDAADRSGTKLAVGHQLRCWGRITKAREIIAAGEIGEPYYFHGICDGGDLLSNATHTVDLLRLLANDAPIKWVIGQIDARSKLERYAHYVEDFAVGYWEYQGGARGFIEVGKYSAKGYHHIYVDGIEGRIEIGAPDGPGLRVRGRGDGEWRTPEFEDGNPSTNAARELVRAIEEDREHISSGRQGRATHELLLAIFESSLQRGVIHLPLESRDFVLERLHLNPAS